MLLKPSLTAMQSILIWLLQVSSSAVNCLRISFDNDLVLSLYRHWSILKSLNCTSYTAARFRVWTPGGRQRLSEFLAELGLPLAQCRQRFDGMDLSLKEKIIDVFASKAEKYNLDRLTKASFLATLGYRSKYSADDVALAVAALLSKVEHSKEGEDGEDGERAFLHALDALSARTGRLDTLEEGVAIAKELLEEIAAQVKYY